AVEEISGALREQSAASQQIAGNIERIAQMTEENSVAVEEVSNSAGHMQGLANELRSHVARFRL
ncbi:MAG: putative citrate chemoreceptor protein, partial [Pseudomonadota bacterium]